MEDRATIFGGEAEAYDRLRPRYPAAVIDLIVAGRPDLVVDVGCGTGIAARQVAERDVAVIGVEADPRMAVMARSHGIEVTVSTLESWPAVPCDVLYAAQAWHWIDPGAGARVAAASIRPGGRWMAFWNIEIDPDLDVVRNDVYRRHAPEIITDWANASLGDDRFESAVAAGIEETGCFEPMGSEVVHWTDRIGSGHFVDRLDSHSSHRLVGDERRARVRTALLDALGRDAELQVRYATRIWSAQRR